MMCSLGYFIQSAVHTYKIKIMSLQFYQLLSFFLKYFVQLHRGDDS